MDRDASFHLSDYDYPLPSELVAQMPASSRHSSRMMVLDRSTGHIQHRSFSDLPDLLKPTDLLVLNDTKVVPARLLGQKETGGRIEVLVLEPFRSDAPTTGVTCLFRSSKPVRRGMRLLLEGRLRAVVLDDAVDGMGRLRFEGGESTLTVLERYGRVPLPPYIHRDPNERPSKDLTSYQTIYAERPGAVAAPTAGLHFSRKIFRQLRAVGIPWVFVTLHVGYGTFEPIRCQDVRVHRMHSEYVEISPSSASLITRALDEGRRIVAVGTTVVRTLEWAVHTWGSVIPCKGVCRLYIYPGFPFRVTGALITNFHLPRSSLILLVSAFAGRKQVLSAYGEAVKKRYRFYSYGDAMFIQ